MKIKDLVIKQLNKKAFEFKKGWKELNKHNKKTWRTKN